MWVGLTHLLLHERLLLRWWLLHAHRQLRLQLRWWLLLLWLQLWLRMWLRLQHWLLLHQRQRLQQ